MARNQAAPNTWGPGLIDVPEDEFVDCVSGEANLPDQNDENDESDEA